MALAQLCEAATLHARYQAQAGSLSVDLAALAETLSPKAAAFIEYLVGPNGNPHDITSLYRQKTPWSDEMLGALAALPRDACLEALTYLAVPVHEYVHHVDISSTPFGAFLQTHVVSEFIAFQTFAEVFMREPDLVPTGNLASLGGIFLEGEARLVEPYRSQWRHLEKHIEWARVWRDFDDLPPPPIDASETETMSAFGMVFRPARVAGWWESYSLESQSGWYITPTTILELRGVAASLIWLLLSLRNWNRCGAIVGDLVETLYPPIVSYDYRLVLDLAASAAKRSSFGVMVRELEPARVAFCLEIFSRAGWVALHAAPPSTKAPDVGLPARLLYTLQRAEQIESKHAPTFLDQIFQVDTSPVFVENHVAIASNVLKQTKTYLDEAVAGFPLIINKETRNYLLGRLKSTAQRLFDRSHDGYSWAPGIPSDGNPIAALLEVAPDLLTLRPVPESFDAWLRLRRQGLFRPTTASNLRRQIETIFHLEFLDIPCPCGRQLSNGLPPELPYFTITCPSCRRLFAVPGAMLRRSQTVGKATVKFREVLFSCACGRRLMAMVFVKYVMSFEIECQCGKRHKIDAATVMGILAKGGIKGRLAQTGVLMARKTTKSITPRRRNRTDTGTKRKSH